MADNAISTSQPEEALPPGVFAALLPRRSRPEPTPLTSFPGDANIFIILRKGVARLMERPSIQLLSLPEPSAPIEWWLITLSPMEFENIGFSKPVAPLSNEGEGKQSKLLLCAQCDLGPLGRRNRILAGLFQGWIYPWWNCLSTGNLRSFVPGPAEF
ncbi:hypothetical protein DFH07DRAFT_768044 [Mycena maculata]|uniref:Uncharacterized protein n=1 Tax=Mycena maculata TaxID=230809 RepID=A0AAD7JUD5_9AGAR|nr:hypothetical protein DFH07DRAFT_768044 [Mycena maculata]